MFKIVTGLAAAAGLLCLATPAQASNTAGNGCPPVKSGFVLWDVGNEPYHADNLVDEAGNNDGWACARPTYVVTDENGDPFQIYNFIDNGVAG
jgi:hypothetical protein